MYEVMYRVGITPWERAGELGSEQLLRLLGNESRGPRGGRALDVGCGTGRHTLQLAELGWDAVGVDNVQRAIEIARGRPGAEAATFVVGDVLQLDEQVQGPVSFFLDIGCFHGLKGEQRAALGSGITKIAADDATMLMMAFGPNKFPMLPRGVSRGEIEEAFPSWRVDHVEPASIDGMPKPIRATKPTFYRLVRA
jgi:SAM-dependent methyltransferase